MFTGRIGRKNFWLGSIVYVVIYFLLLFIPSTLRNLLPTSNTTDAILILPSFLLILFGLFLWLSLIVRRLHDSNKSGFYAFCIVIPVLGYIILLYFLIVKGDEKSNNYGVLNKKTPLLNDIFKIKP